MPLRRPLLVAALALAALAPAAHAGTRALQPFPSNLQTKVDLTQLTGLRVDLPQPNCATSPSDCADVAVLNRLDGFNVQPRISIPFSGPIDLSTVSSSSIYLRRVACVLCAPIGINQIVWEPLTSTLHVESDQLLAQHSAYLLVVTRAVRDASGRPLDPLDLGRARDYAGTLYRRMLTAALTLHGDLGAAAAASLFTTQSVTADMEKIRRQLDAARPAPATIEANVARASLTGILWSRQTAATAPTTAAPVLGVLALDAAVGRLVFGSYSSPDYEVASEIPATPTRTGVPTVQGTNTLRFTLFLPASPKPAGGWPVAIFGHGFTDSKQGAPYAVASSLAHAGIATIAINVVGHGGGPLGSLTLLTAGGPVVVPDGGRAFDQDGNGTITLGPGLAGTEGINTALPDTLVGSRDTLRQTVIDLMQLVRVLQVGLDADRDGRADLDAARISYVGQSFGGIYGIDFLALEPDVPAGVANVPGGSIIEVARLGSFRGLVAQALLQRTPPLFNGTTNFNENQPLRDVPPVIDTVPGASAIQLLLDRNEWAQQAANPAALALYVRARPLPGNPPKSVIVQFAKGDRTVPNPTTTAILRAGALADRATYFRNDLAGPAAMGNPHTFLTAIVGPTAPIAIAAQTQIALFLATGAVVDPDGPGPLFETPIAPPLPEGLN